MTLQVAQEVLDTRAERKVEANCETVIILQAW